MVFQAAFVNLTLLVVTLPHCSSVKDFIGEDDVSIFMGKPILASVTINWTYNMKWNCDNFKYARWFNCVHPPSPAPGAIPVDQVGPIAPTLP